MTALKGTSMSLDNLTADHFLRLKAFCEARVDPMLSRAFQAEAADGPEADYLPALQALMRGITMHSAVAGLFELCDRDPQTRMAAETMILDRWSGLRHIARTWRDHPDYLPEFNQEPWQLAAQSVDLKEQP